MMKGTLVQVVVGIVNPCHPDLFLADLGRYTY